MDWFLIFWIQLKNKDNDTWKLKIYPIHFSKKIYKQKKYHDFRPK